MTVRAWSVRGLREGAWPRALRETRAIVVTPAFTVLGVITAAASAAGFVLFQSSTTSLLAKALLAGAGIIAGFLVALLPTFVLVLARTPIWQRDEARRALAEHGGPRISLVHHPEWSMSQLGGRRHLYVTAACGPAVSHPGGWVLTPDAARGFVEEAFPGVFRPYPAEYGPDLISFEVPGDGVLDDPWRRMIRFHSGGLIELTWRLPDPPMVDGGPIPSLVEICRPIYQFAEATRRGAYAKLFPRPVRKRRRLTWLAGVNGQMVTETGSVMCRDLSFPGTVPGGRASRGYWAMNGYYDADLDSDPTDLLRIILEHQLSASGFIDTRAAIEDTIRATTERPSEPTRRYSPAESLGGGGDS